jgi:type IV secretory pathway TraG/TraD family ATPase VirD4
MQTALMPLVGSWVDILCNAVLSLPADPNRRIWLVLDELGALGHLNSLESALMRGRKHGLCVVGGLQSTAQLDQIYGRDGGIVLRSCFRNLVALGIAKIDPDTSDLLSRALGERVVDKMQFSRNHGANGISTGESVQRAQERIVMASQIAGLPNLHAYLALAGDEPVRRITITPRDLPSVTQPFEE